MGALSDSTQPISALPAASIATRGVFPATFAIGGVSTVHDWPGPDRYPVRSVEPVFHSAIAAPEALTSSSGALSSPGCCAEVWPEIGVAVPHAPPAGRSL